MKLARDLQVGDSATTDYVRGVVTIVKITARDDHAVSESGVMFQITPARTKGYDHLWYDSGWFTPINSPNERKRNGTES